MIETAKRHRPVTPDRRRIRGWALADIERLGARFQAGETYKQIAQSIGVSTSTISTLLWRSGYTRRDSD
jgi:Helix-turn-helix domain